MASSSPASLRSTCAWKRAAWSSGSFSSEKPLASLAARHEELEAVGHERIGIVGARQRRYLGRIVVDEGRDPAASARPSARRSAPAACRRHQPCRSSALRCRRTSRAGTRHRAVARARCPDCCATIGSSMVTRRNGVAEIVARVPGSCTWRVPSFTTSHQRREQLLGEIHQVAVSPRRPSRAPSS